MKTPKDLPCWLCCFLKPDEVDKISAAVKKAEEKTSAELVPMIVKQSSVHGHVQMSFVMASLILFLVIEDLLNIYTFDFYWQILNGVVFLLLLGFSFFVHRYHFIQRMFTTQMGRSHQVWARAEIEFYRLNMSKTRERTGVLIFVSLMERMAVVMADKSISDKLPKETWQGVVNVLVAGVKQKDAGSGFERAIQLCGDILAKNFPAHGKNINELSNHLVIKE